MQKGECQCNAGCQSSGNCCIDFLWNQFAFDNLSVAQNIKNYQQKVIESSKSQRCLPLFPFEKDINEYYIMVDSCVADANKTNIERCLNSSSNDQVDQMPVLGDDKYLYKNKFCARCNGVYRYNTKDIIDVSCDGQWNDYNTAVELLKFYKRCYTKVSNKVDEDYSLKCVKKRCNQLDATLCRLIAAQAQMPSKELYKNPFCYNCLQELPRNVNVSSCITEYPGCPGCATGGGGWSRVIDLNDFKESKCGINQLKFREAEGRNFYCKRKICWYNAALIDGKCHSCGLMRAVLQKDNENDFCKCDFVIDSKGDCVCKEGWRPFGHECVCDFDRRLLNGECVCLKGMERQSDGSCWCLKDHVRDYDGCVCRSGMISTPDGKCECAMGRERDSNDNCVCKKGLIPQRNGTCSNDTRSSFKSRGFEMIFENRGELRCLSHDPQLNLYVFIEGNSNTSILSNFHLTKLKWGLNNGSLVLQSADFRKDPNWQTILLQETQSNPNIIKAVVTSERNHHLYTHLYGFDLTRTFNRFKICAKYHKIEIKPNQDCKQALAILQESRNETFSTKIIATFEKGEIHEEICFCEQFHLHSSCIRENIYPTMYNISNNGSLTIGKLEQEPRQYHLQTYRAEDYIPLEKGFQICRVVDSESYEFQQYPWVQPLKSAKAYISLIGTILSLICYLAFLVVFVKVPAIRNRGAFYVMVLVIFLLTSDVLFLVTSYIEIQTAICKWFGMIFYWSMMNVLLWSVIVAIDITLQFTKKLSRPSSLDEAIAVLRKRSIITILISLIVILVIIGLEESNAVSFRFENRCWFGDFYLSLGFYFIPAAIGYMVCFVCLCIVLGSIRKRKSEVERTLNKNSKKDSDLLKIGIKLMLILGITELLGLIQIKSDYLTENEQIFNSLFALLYILLRSFHGLMIFMVYMVNRKTLKLIKEHFLKSLEHHEFSMRTQTSSVMD